MTGTRPLIPAAAAANVPPTLTDSAALVVVAVSATFKVSDAKASSAKLDIPEVAPATAPAALPADRLAALFVLVAKLDMIRVGFLLLLLFFFFTLIVQFFP
jgi:hypothetical protein